LTLRDRDQRIFIPRLESLRGLAALTVAVLHATSSLIQEPARGVLDQIGYPVIRALTNGYGAVIAFFVISGFVLARSIERNFFQASQFALKRILRLVPAASVAVGIFALVFYSFGFTLYSGASYTPTSIALNAIMLRADIDRVMWSMKAEVAATPLIFFSTWLARHAGPKYLIPLAATLFGLSFIGQYCHAIGDDTNLGPLFAFAVGVWLHFAARAIVNRLFPCRRGSRGLRLNCRLLRLLLFQHGRIVWLAGGVCFCRNSCWTDRIPWRNAAPCAARSRTGQVLRQNLV
jgi:peptidoglycan/LPS O-acetylase OafA/YrhL